MKKDVYETSLPENWSKQLFEDFLYDLGPKHFDKIAYVLFTATSEILNDIKSKEKPMAFIFEKMNKEFVAGAICQYFDNTDDPSLPGNYSLTWTFDEADIPDNAERVSCDHPDVFAYFNGVASSKYKFTYENLAAVTTLSIATLSNMKKWLDENASETEEVSFEVEGVVEGRVAVENGIKVFALAPSGIIKMLVKNDASIEK